MTKNSAARMRDPQQDLINVGRSGWQATQIRAGAAEIGVFLLLVAASLLIGLPTMKISSAQIGGNLEEKSPRHLINDSYINMPVVFEMNQGQLSDRVKFISRGAIDLYMTADEVVLSLPKHSARIRAQGGSLKDSQIVKFEPGIRHRATLEPRDEVGMRLVGAFKAPVVGLEEVPGTVNYFIGKDPGKWKTGIRTFRKVIYKGIYPGIDEIFYGSEQQLEYDFIVSPGANSSAIKLRFKGPKVLTIDGQGNLGLRMESGGEIRLHKPVAYQDTTTGRQEITARYTLRHKNQVGFEIGDYDRSKPLIIDPVLSYSTYLGGSGNDTGFDTAVDPSGNVYVTGSTDSSEFSPLGGTNVFVAKLNPAGTQRLYLAIIGGSGDDTGFSLAIDGFGSAYVAGATDSSDFPLLNSFQSSFGGGSQDAFFSKLSPSGNSLLYSTYFGGRGNDTAFAIAVDATGCAYAAGSTDSTELSTLGNADAFVTKISSSGASREYFSILGGSGDDTAFDLALDGAGNVYVVGSTDSPNFSTVNALQPNYGGLGDAFLAKLNLSGAIVYATYFGGSGTDSGYGIAVGGAGEPYISGATNSPEFTGLGGRDAFVAKFNSTGAARDYLTILGGSRDDVSFAIAVDTNGNAYVTGSTSSNNFTTAKPIQGSLAGAQDVFVSKLNSTGSSLEFSTYIGGGGNQAGFAVAIDSTRTIVVTGFTDSNNFPIANPFQSTSGGNGDAFVLKLSPTGGDPTPTPTPTVTPTPTPLPGSIRLILDESGPASIQVAAVDSMLFTRDPFPVVNPNSLLNRTADKNTRLLVFAINLQLAFGETPAVVVINIVDANNQIIDVSAEDVRAVSNTDLTQITFRLPNNLAVGTCTLKLKFHNQISNSGIIRIRV